MADDILSGSLEAILEQQSETITKPASDVLFRRGDSAAGMFVVLSGKVAMDGRQTGHPERGF